MASDWITELSSFTTSINCSLVILIFWSFFLPSSTDKSLIILCVSETDSFSLLDESCDEKKYSFKKD